MVAKYLTVRRGRFYCIFIDFSKAFDSVHHDLLWDKLIRYGIHGNFLSVLRSMYMSLQSCVNTSVGITDYFDCTIGTRQGCMLSPILFSLFINDLVSYTNKVGCEGIYVDEEAHQQRGGGLDASIPDGGVDAVGRLALHLARSTGLSEG